MSTAVSPSYVSSAISPVNAERLTVGSALAHVEAFAARWQALHRKTCKSADTRAKVAQEALGPVRQMLDLALQGTPKFAIYLREERGLKEATVA